MTDCKHDEYEIGMYNQSIQAQATAIRLMSEIVEIREKQIEELKEDVKRWEAVADKAISEASVEANLRFVAEKQVEKLREALRFYADERCIAYIVVDSADRITTPDDGERARAALGEE